MKAIKKTHKKRILSILLMMCMVFTLLPITVLAAPSTEITSVEVSCITLPIAGETPDYNVTLPSGASYHLATDEELRDLGWLEQDMWGVSNGVCWYDEEGKYMSSSEKFQAGKEYYVEVSLLPNTGYTFKDVPNGILNNSRDTKASRIYKNVLILWSVNWKAVVSTPITSVDVSGITLPIAGATPDFEGILPAGAPYHFASRQELKKYGYYNTDDSINGIWWVAGSNMAADDTYVNGQDYDIELVLIPNRGYKFADNVTCKINNDAELVDLYNTYSDVTSLFIESIRLQPTAPTITSVKVTGITLPIAGETPDYNVTLPSGASYHLATDEELRALGWLEQDMWGVSNGVCWYDEEGKYMSSSDKFQAGKEYYVEVSLLPNTGYTFKDVPNGILNSSTDTKASRIYKNVLILWSVNWKAAESTHNYGTEWKTDASSHWHECSCGSKTGLQSHTFSTAVFNKELKAYEKTCFCGYTVRYRELGDVDGDGSISASDARLALRLSVKLETTKTLGATSAIVADIDGSGVSAADARLILRASVKLEDASKWKPVII